MKNNIQKGFSLVTAIFLLVVLASLGAVMMTFFTAQQQSSALDVTGSRAFHAARAGIEWGAYQVLQNTAGPYATACQAGTTSQALAAGTLAGTLSGFDVSVACSASTHNEASTASGSLTVYRIISTASRGAAGQPDYVQREIQATIGQ